MVSCPVKRRMIPSWAQPFVYDPFPDGGSLVILLILQCVPLNWTYWNLRVTECMSQNILSIYSNKQSVRVKDQSLQREESELL